MAGFDLESAIPVGGGTNAPAPAAPQSDNVFDLASARPIGQAQTIQQAQAVAVANSDQSADTAGRAAQVGRQIGAPQAAVETDLPRFEAQAKAQQNAATLAASPKLAGWVAQNPDSARVAQDDFDGMADIEKIVSGQVVDEAGQLVKGLAKGVGTSFTNSALALNRGVGGALSLVDRATGTDASDWWYQHMTAPALANRAALAEPATAPFGVKAADTVGNMLGTLAQVMMTGGGAAAAEGAEATSTAGAVGQQVAHGARAMAFPALTSAVNTGKDVYDQTGDMGQAIRAAQMSYATTTLGGVVPLGAEGGLATRAVSGFVSGAAAGEVSRQAMNLVMPQQEGFDPVNTILSGLSGAMLSGALGRNPLHDAVRQAYADGLDAETAERGAANIQQIAELAAASKLRTHDPEAFRNYVASVAEDGPLTDVYVDGKTFADALHQSQVDPANIPGLNDRLQEAVATGGDVQIPIEDYATHIAGTDLDKAIQPELKAEEGGMTAAEGAQFFQSAKDEMTARAEELAKEPQTQEQQDIQKIHDTLLEQMAATGRYPADVARASLAPVTEFYRTMAERVGTTPGEMYARYPLRIAGEDAADSLHQGEREGPFGPIFDQFSGDAQGAIEHLKAQKTGEAIGALHHPDIGDIDLPWGKEGTGGSDGYGLAKLVKFHPDVVENLQDILSSMKVTTRSDNRVNLESTDHKAGVRLTWNGIAKKWLLTAFRKGDAAGTTTDTAGARETDDTARRSNAAKDSIDQDLQKFYQGHRGAFSPDANTIALMKDADLSTFLHESGHFFLSTLGDLAARPDAPEQIKQDMQTAIEWMGGKDLADWQGRTLDEQRDMHEKFARGFESYLMEGKAPTQAMQPLFARFRSWLVNVYRSVTGLGAELTPEVRSVFDRLLASDDAIRQTEAARGYLPLDLSKSGATEKQQSDYAALGEQATQDALTDMQVRSVRDMRWASNAKNKAIKAMQREANEARRSIRDEVTKEVMDTPVEKARTFIKEMNLDLNPDRAAYAAAREQYEANRDEAARSSMEAWLAANPEPKIAPKVEGEKPNAAERKEHNVERKEWATRRDAEAQARAEQWAAANPEPVKPTTPLENWKKERTAAQGEFADQVKGEYLTSPEAAGLVGIKKGQYLARVKREMANEVERRVLDWEKQHPAPREETTRVPPDLVAEQFGFGSGKELQAALSAQTPEAKIQDLVDERMLQRHGELIDPYAIEQAANEAVHNEARARFMATGLKLLAKSPVPARELAKAATEAAQTAIAAKRVRDLNPRQYEVAETKANREAIAQAPKDPAAAVQAQRQALLSNRLAKAARDAAADVKKIVSTQSKYDKASIRAKMDPDILEQIDALRERFDFRQRPPEGPTKQQAQLQQWVDTQKAYGYAPVQHPDMMDPSVRMHYKDMTVEQLRGFSDTIRSMEQIARERKSITLQGKRVQLDEVVGDLVEKMKARGEQFTTQQLVDRPRTGTDPFFKVALDRMASFLRASAAEFKPQQFKANQFDQHEILGPFTRAIFDRVFDANYHKIDMLKALAGDFRAGAEQLGRDWQDSLSELVPNARLVDADLTQESGKTVYRRLTRGDMLGIARHVGNESNFDKLVKGMGWEPGDVWTFLNEHMTPKDWRATQMTWDAFEKHWPDMVEMNRRLGNVSPERIEPRAFRTASGIDLKGGYAPIDYDPIRSKLAVRKSDASAINPSEGLFGRGYFRADTTTNGSLNARVASYYDRLDLDFHSIERRLHDTVHDLAYREALLDAHKVLSDADFRRQFQLTYGPEQYKSMQEWVGDLANGQNSDAQQSRLSQILQSTRHMVVANGIALRISTVIKHGGSAAFKSAGYFSGPGAKYFAARASRMATDNTGQIAGAVEKFSEIRARAMQQDRDYRQTTASLFQPEGFQSKAERFGHAMVAYMDLMSAVPTAWGAYDRAITEGIPTNRGGTGQPMSEEDAVEYANQVVREAHGSNIESARSMVLQSKSEATKMFTMMYGFMNNSLGQTMDMADKLRTAGFSKPEVLARFMCSIIAPALAAGLVEHHKKDEGWAEWAAKAITGEVAGMVPLVRDAWNAVRGYPSAGLAPLMQTLSYAAKPFKDAWDAAHGKTVKAPIKDLGNAIGLALPGAGQIGTTLQYAADWKSGKQQPKNVVDVARGLALGQGNQ
jgi:hypothetical protein